MARRPAPAAKDDASEAAGEARLADAWMQEIDAALKREEDWRKRAKKVVARYRDERDTRDEKSKINILWSNTEVLKAALYSRTAVPDIRRRFPDAKKGNSAARYAAEVLERSIRYVTDAYDVDTPIGAAVSDMLLAGRGVTWVSYEPEIDGDEIREQKLCLDFVYWEDFCHGLARAWEGVPWVGRRHAMPKREFQGRFPDIRAKRGVSAEYNIKDASGATEEAGEKQTFVEVWEIWDKGRRQRIFIARGYADVLQVDEDPYQLQGFFPCPRPLYGVTTTDTMRPEPEYCQYQDQAEELDIVATRIRNLTEFMVWAGIYDASISDVASIKDVATARQDGVFLPHQRFQEIRDKGGIESAFGFLPIERIGPVVAQLRLDAESLIQEIYQITGISDVIRGATDPNETKGAQVLKARFGSMRLQRRQRDVQRFVRDLYRIMAEIVAEHFTVETLSEITQIDLPLTEPDPLAQALMGGPSWTPALPMLPSPAAAGPGAVMPGGPGLMAPGGASPPPAPMQPSLGPPGMLPADGAVPPAAPPPSSPMLAPPPGMQPPMGPNAAPPMMQGEAPPTVGKPEEPKPTWPEVIGILRSDKLRGYRVDIETDSTLLEDAAVDKQERIEFGAAFERIIQGAYVAATTAPSTLPLIKETALFMVRSYRPGRVMEETLEDAFAELAKNPPPNPNAAPQLPPPGPEPMGEADKAKLALEAQKADGERAYKMAQLSADTEYKQAVTELDAAHKAALVQIEQQRLDLERQQAELAAQSQARAAEMEARKLAMQAEQFDRSQQVQTTQFETTRKDRGLPDGHAMTETAAAWQQQAAQLGDVLKAIMGRLDQQAQGIEVTMKAVQTVERGSQVLAEAIRGVVEQMAAPVELIRDPVTGKAIGTRKGAIARDVVRGPDGQVTGLQ